MAHERRLPAGLRRLPSCSVQARYKDADGRSHSRTFTLGGALRTDAQVRAAAIVWLEEQRTQVRHGVHFAVADGRQILGAYAASLQESGPLGPTARVNSRSVLRALQGSALGGTPLAAIRTSHVRAWLREVDDRLRAVHGPSALAAPSLGPRLRDRRPAHRPLTGDLPGRAAAGRQRQGRAADRGARWGRSRPPSRRAWRRWSCSGRRPGCGPGSFSERTKE